MKLRPERQGGAALLVILIAICLAASYFFLLGTKALGEKTSRDKITAAALAQAQDALIGYAATYRESHPDEVYGFLPCPDTNNDGFAESSCGTADISAIGRLPWKTLGIPPLRDGSGECLWYAVSGHGKNSFKTAALNWDSTGQFIVQDAGGGVLTGPTAHDLAMAVVFAPQAALGTQDRTPTGTSICGGNDTVSAYLEGAALSPAADANSTLVLSTPASVEAATNNDQGAWITPKQIFDRIKRRNTFKNDVDNLVTYIAGCLNTLPVASLPAPSGSKGAGAIDSAVGPGTPCPNPSAQTANFIANWRNNLLYAKPGGTLTVSKTACNAVLLFGGERTGNQVRATTTQKDAAANYLESDNATLFPGAGNYNGAASFTYSSANTDVAACITGLPDGATQFSFANNFNNFVAAGPGVTVDAANQATTIATGGPGNSGGCFWYPNPLALAGKTLRSYYEFRFQYADDRAVTGHGTDRGYGFTFQLVHGGYGSPTGVCGKESDMGAMALNGPGDIWGAHSFIIETDVYQDKGNTNDPAANHTAIMANGNLDHSNTANGNGYTTTACNGSAQGCAHSPADTFEESPVPTAHRQRLEITTGCNPGCSSCVPAAYNPPNTYARIRVWVDCANCTDLTADFSAAPTAQRCINLATPDAGLNNPYFGFSGGFRSGNNGAQGVTISNFTIRIE